MDTKGRSYGVRRRIAEIVGVPEGHDFSTITCPECGTEHDVTGLDLYATLEEIPDPICPHCGSELGDVFRAAAKETR